MSQINQLFRNLGSRQFQDMTAAAGLALQLSEVSRGAAFGDVDNDGDTDALILNNNGPVRLLLNNLGNQHHWLGLRLLLKEVTRDALGARVAVVRSSRPTLWRRARSDASYCSANDPRVLVGLGTDPEFDAVRVQWPDGSVEEWRDLTANAYHTLHQGSGRIVE